MVARLYRLDLVDGTSFPAEHEQGGFRRGGLRHLAGSSGVGVEEGERS